MKMRTRPALLILIWCCAGMSAGTAAASSGPNVTVTTPDAGLPAPPTAVQAALSRDAFTPYSAVQQRRVAPNTSSEALSAACMTVAGYPNSTHVPFAVRFGLADLGFAQPWGQAHVGGGLIHAGGFR